MMCKPLLAACGIQFPNRRSNLVPLHWECGVNHWTTREAPPVFKRVFGFDLNQNFCDYGKSSQCCLTPTPMRCEPAKIPQVKGVPRKSWERSRCLPRMSRGPCAHLAGRAITPARDSITLLPSCIHVSSPHSLSHEAP